jgi:hypothetical protein
VKTYNLIPVRLRVLDIGAEGHRFVLLTPDGGEVFFSVTTTADDLARYCDEEGWRLARREEQG